MTISSNGAKVLDAKVPEGPFADKWDNHKFDV